MTKAKSKTSASKETVAEVPAILTKSEQVIDLMRRKAGASLSDITNITGWLPHSARAALTGLRKRGFVLDKTNVEGTTHYTISAEPSA